MSNQFLGGQVLLSGSHVEFYFAAPDDTNPAKVCMQYDPQQPVEAYVAIAARIAKDGLPGIFTAGTVVPITFEHYQQLII